MKEAHYTDKAGRMWATQLPDNAPDTDAELGLPLGPPSLEGLNLPEELEVRLHNQLYHRRIFTYSQAKADKLNVQAAMQATLKLDVLHIVEIYRNTENSYTDGNVEGEKKGKQAKP